MNVDEERAFVEAILTAVEALERRAEQAVERVRTEHGADAGSRDEGAESAYVEAAACLAEVRDALGAVGTRGRLAQALSAALAWAQSERADACAAAEVVGPGDEREHALGRAEALAEIATELSVLYDAATRSAVLGSA